MKFERNEITTGLLVVVTVAVLVLVILLLAAPGSAHEAVADVPGAVVDAFYRVRFGSLDLTAADLGHLDARLDALESQLQTPA